LKKNQPQLGVTSRQRTHKPGQWPSDSEWSGALPDTFDTQKSITGDPQEDLDRSPLADASRDGSAASQEARRQLMRPSSLAERARMNAAWLDSSLSLLAQDVQEHDLLQLRYKFAAIQEPSRENDAVRVHQLFEQARLQLLAGEIDCSEAEMYVFAALQLQAGWGSHSGTGPTAQLNASTVSEPVSVDEEIESAIDELRARLEGTASIGNGRDGAMRVGGGISNGNRSGGLTHVPELSDYLQVMQPRRFTLRSSKSCFCVIKDCRLLCYKNHEERGAQPQITIRLLGAELTPDAQPAARKYMVKLEVPEHAVTGASGGEFWLRFEEQRQYVRWLAAFRLAARGKTMADAVAYESELRQIDELLALQQPVGRNVAASSTSLDPTLLDRMELDDLMAPRFLRKIKSRKQVSARSFAIISNYIGNLSIDTNLCLFSDHSADSGRSRERQTFVSL
jgi:kindlin 2